VSTSVVELEAQALQLSPEDRAQLADKLLASLNPDADLDAAWSVEADRRLTELENGSAVGIPIELVIARARDAIR